jgi:hypothetical protein
VIWWAKIAAWFAGGGANGLAAELRRAHADRLAAQTDSEKLAADERMTLVAARVDAQTQGAGSITAKIMRAGYGVPPMIYNAKLFLWDKVLGWGTTDALSPYLENVAWTVIGFYFLDNTLRLARR